MDDVPGCNHLRGCRTLAGGEAGRWRALFLHVAVGQYLH